MPASPPPPLPHGDGRAPEETGSLVLRFGTAVGLAAVAALACAVPATVRVSTAVAGAAAGHVWVALAAAALGPMIVSVVVLRGAREGLHAFAGPGAGLRAWGVGLWLASLVVMLSLFGASLRATTHHHALAGVTFAFGAVALAAGSALVCARTVAILRAMPERPRRALAAAIGAVTLAALAWVALRLEREASRDAASSAAAGVVVDVLAFVLAALLASRLSLAARRPLALFGPPFAVAVAALGITTLREPPVRDAVGQLAPAFVPATEFLSGH